MLFLPNICCILVLLIFLSWIFWRGTASLPFPLAVHRKHQLIGPSVHLCSFSVSPGLTGLLTLLFSTPGLQAVVITSLPLPALTHTQQQFLLTTFFMFLTLPLPRSSPPSSNSFHNDSPGNSPGNSHCMAGPLTNHLIYSRNAEPDTWLWCIWAVFKAGVISCGAGRPNGAP